MESIEELDALALEATGREALMKGDVASATACLHRGLTLLPTDAGLLRLAEAIHEHIHPEHSAARADDSTARVAATGAWLLSDGFGVSAEPLLHKAVTLDPDNPAYRRLWLSALSQNSRHDDVLRYSLPRLRSGRIDPDEANQVLSAALAASRYTFVPILHLKLSKLLGQTTIFDGHLKQSYISLQQYNEAAKYISPEETSPDQLFIDSVIYAGLSDYLKALDTIDRAIKLDPNNTTYLLHYVAVLGCLGRHEEAVALCDRLPLHEPGGSGMWRSAFAVYTEAGRYEDAIRIGARIAESDPTDVDFLAVYQTLLGKQVYANLLKDGIAGNIPTEARIRSSCCG